MRDSSSTPPSRRSLAATTFQSERAWATHDSGVREVPIGLLKPNRHQTKKHPKQQIQKIAAGISQFGFLGVIVANGFGDVLAGHARLAAAKLAGLTTVPCMRADHLSLAAERAFMLADNKLAEESVWYEEQLKFELHELSIVELPFEFEITGFDSVDLDRILSPEPRMARADGTSADPDDEIPPLQSDAITQCGDLWLLGDHRLLCGDALNPEAFRNLLRGEVARQVFTDPPYNVAIAGHVTSKRGFREFGMASGEMSTPQFTRFLQQSLSLAARGLANGGILHVCMDWRHLPELLEAARAVGLSRMNMCIWVKPNAGMGSFYRSQHEIVVVFKVGKAAHINTFGLGKRGRNRSNIWRYPSVRGPRRGLDDPKAGGHPTVKPVTLVIDAIRDCSHRGDIILDVFGGSGTTLIAAERVGRRARLLELDPVYCDLIVRRWQRLTRRAAVRESDGLTFDEAQARRRSAAANADGEAPRKEIGHE